MTPSPARAETLPLLYRDDWLVAVHKPAGLLVHRTAIDRHATRFALQMARDQLGRRVYPVHRLDRPTAGLLLFTLDPLTASRLTAAFTAGQVDKTYLAVARGHTEAEGCIDYPLVEEPDELDDPRTRPDKAAQPAVTEYRRLAIAELPVPVGRYSSARYSLLRLAPRTGRRHQIRRHLKHIFHPIVGDTSHGDGRHNRFFREHFGCGRLLLAAVGLRLTHPAHGTELRLHAPLDDGFRNILNHLGWPPPDGAGPPPHS